jgi:2-polyprenyl-3-methyl-5-hydroxy-6-metoxy-1,4-benzoquinol methylase
MDYDPFVGLYQRQYADYRDDLHFYGRLCERLALQRVLELGAGMGRVSIALARRGIAVTGLELSPKMIEIGQQHSQSAGLTVEWRLGDMRSFDLGRKWPLIIAPFNALMHLYSLEDQDRALTAIKRHLEPGGSLAFDLYVPKFGPEGVLRHEGETFWDKNGEQTDVLFYQNQQPALQTITTQYLVDSIGADGSLKRQSFELHQRYFMRYELERWLRGQGFQMQLYGDFELGRFDRESHLMVVVASLGQ